MNLPRYVKCISLADKAGKIVPEWVIRLCDLQMEDKNGNKVPTPPELLNRYYTVKSPYLGKSIFSKRPNKDVLFMTYEELESFRCKDRLECN